MEKDIEFSNLLKNYINEIQNSADRNIREAIESEMQTRGLGFNEYGANLETMSFVTIEEKNKSTYNDE